MAVRVQTSDRVLGGARGSGKQRSRAVVPFRGRQKVLRYTAGSAWTLDGRRTGGACTACLLGHLLAYTTWWIRGYASVCAMDSALCLVGRACDVQPPASFRLLRHAS